MKQTIKMSYFWVLFSTVLLNIGRNLEMESQMQCNPDCTASCQSTVHGCTTVKAVLAEAPEEAIAAFLVWLCRNFAKATDHFGRTALHFAASCGKVKLVEWLLLHGHADPNVRDLESGWTPLHRSIYYGHFNVAAALMKVGLLCINY